MAAALDHESWRGNGLLPEWQVPVLTFSRRRHRPDFGIEVGGGRVAIEIELTAKAADRLRATCRAYQRQVEGRRLSGVANVVNHPAVRRSVDRAARSAGLGQQQFRIMEFADVRQMTRELASGPAPQATVG